MLVPHGDHGVAQDYSAPEVTEAEYVHIGDYLRILTKWRWLIAAFIGAGLLAAFGYNWRSTPIFQASARLVIEGDSNVLGLAQPVVDQRAWLGNFQPTQLVILQSTSLARRASEDLRGTAGPGMHVPSPGEIKGGLVVALIKDTRLVNVGFRSPDPALAARVANAVPTPT